MQYDHGVGRFEMAMICGLAIDDNIHNAGEVWKIPAGADDATNAVLYNGMPSPLKLQAAKEYKSSKYYLANGVAQRFGRSECDRFFSITETATALTSITVPGTPRPAEGPGGQTDANPLTNNSIYSNLFLEGIIANPEHWYEMIFYRLGDLIDAFLHVTDGRQQMIDNDVALILGSCTVKNRFYETRWAGHTDHTAVTEYYGKVYPLYDILIEKNEYFNMLNEKFINTSKSSISLSVYIEGLLEIVRKYYSVGDAVTQSKSSHPLRSISFNAISTNRSMLPPPGLLRAANMLKVTGGGISISGITTTGPDPTTVPATAYLINVGDTSPPRAGILTSNSLQTQSRQDPVYRIGSATTAIKKVRFNRVQTSVQKGTESDNIAAVATGARGTVIPQYFNCDVDMMGNVKAAPGFTFNLKPFAPTVFRNSAQSAGNTTILQTLGLDNHNIAITVNHKINPQIGFITSIKSISLGPSDVT